MAIVRVAPAGWPTRTADGKTPKFITKTSANAMATPGAMSGHMTRRKIAHGPAPRTRAAASSAGSMPET